ncbi:hypothetical protein TrVE_jg9719 [Triparma verrucosa]|uniref:Plant heme peroxidase family profile domain-containing protein n=1 Tax=Triparma verrucosa TaxID=1606542 RepID=A0A9W7CE33_9STRA|nr:hypothetical protein TrVE_jg9719 [Triparma verrucosa]
MAIAGASAVLGPSPAEAIVYYDPMLYGDAELKVAVINRVRQKVRDAITKDPALGVELFSLGIADSLKYNAKTQEGGGDGSVTKLVDSAASKFAVKLSKDLQKSTQITLADVVALASAEAYETFGGLRVRVQIGRVGGDKAATAQNVQAVLSPSWDASVTQTFEGAGLGKRDVAALDAVRGGMAEVVKNMQMAKEDEAYVNEMGETDFIPKTSFGGASQIFGASLTPFDDKYLKAAVKGKKGVFADDNVRAAGEKMSIKSGKDGAIALERVLAVGKVYTGGKIGDLTGQ